MSALLAAPDMIKPTWTPGLDRALLGFLRRGLSTPSLIGEFRSMGFSADDVLDRFLVLLGSSNCHPLTRALAVLGPRVRPGPSSGTLPYRLDGRPADARAVVRCANDVLDAMGLAPIPWPGVAS